MKIQATKRGSAAAYCQFDAADPVTLRANLRRATEATDGAPTKQVRIEIWDGLYRYWVGPDFPTSNEETWDTPCMTREQARSLWERLHYVLHILHEY